MKWGLFVLVLFVSVACFRQKEKDEQPVAFCGTESPPVNPKDQELISVPFKAHCSVCHAYDQHLTGPALKGIEDRVPGEKWLRLYLTNHDSLAKSGDSTFRYWQNYSPASCVIKKGLTSKEVDDLILYMRE